METLNLKDLKLTANESKDIIKFIAKKRSTTTKKILETINQNQKRRINKKLTEKQLKLIKSQKSQQKIIKSQKLPQKKPNSITRKTNKITTKTNKIKRTNKTTTTTFT